MILRNSLKRFHIVICWTYVRLYCDCNYKKIMEIVWNGNNHKTQVSYHEVSDKGLMAKNDTTKQHALENRPDNEELSK